MSKDREKINNNNLSTLFTPKKYYGDKMPYFNLSDSTNSDIANQVKQKVVEAQNIANTLINVSGQLNSLRNLFYNESFFELFVANQLNHVWNSETQGADATSINDPNIKYEYKTVKKKTNYTSLSFQFHWLSNGKIQQYNEITKFYFIWRDGNDIDMIIEVDPKFIVEIDDKGKGTTLISKIESKQATSNQSAGHFSISAGSFLNKLWQNIGIGQQILNFEFKFISQNIEFQNIPLTTDVLNCIVKDLTQNETRKQQIRKLKRIYG